MLKYIIASLSPEVHSCCRLVAGSVQGLPETSNSMMNSMLTAMRSGISAVGRRMGVNLPLPLRKMLEGPATIACAGNLHVNLLSLFHSASPACLLGYSTLHFMPDSWCIRCTFTTSLSQCKKAERELPVHDLN